MVRARPGFLDPLKNVVTLDWWMSGTIVLTMPLQAALGRSLAQWLIYTSILLSLGGSPQNPPSDNEAASQITFQHNATAFALNSPAALPVFRTQLDIRPRPFRAHVDLVNYPLDMYTASASAFARANDTGEAVGVWIFNATGAAFGFTTTMSGVNVDAHGVTAVDIFFGRALSVKLYIFTIIFGMWLISLAQMAAMIKAVVFGYSIETAVLILPIATMIAFAQLRSSFPDAPAGFATNIDVLGSLPTYVCLVFTAVGSLIHCLSRPEPKSAKGNEPANGLIYPNTSLA
ncbi:hypothetical protein BGW80DRAFT_225801 [Lactifluus volemus]|nr:hypothetical protein BGW80DRAFT_225801 [Lactifluus volemus]